MNLYEASLTVISEYDPPNPRAPTRVTARVRSSRFEHNERGLALLGSFQSAAVVDCVFAGNAAMHAGAGLLIYTYQVNPEVNVSRCRFLRNAAGSVDVDAFAAYADSFRVHNNEVSPLMHEFYS